MRVEINGINIFENNKFHIDFYANKNVSESDKLFMREVHGVYYYSPVMALIGVNASGKTTALNSISLATQLHIERVPLGRTWLGEMHASNSLISSQLEISSFIYLNNELIKILTIVERSENTIKEFENNNFRIIEEHLYTKKINNVSKKDLYKFVKRDLQYTKSSLKENEIYYSDDLSIIHRYYNTKKVEDFNLRPSSKMIRELETESKLLSSDINTDFAMYLDSSIEILEKVAAEKINGFDNLESTTYKLKFKHSKNEYELRNNQLSKVLSTGTSRGINLFSYLMSTLKSGGYLFIDEIENNLNKAIIIDILKLFYSKKTNPNGAVIIFSTHYSEILDSVRRNDSIHLFEKNNEKGSIVCSNFADLIKRNDLKKSEAIFSGNLTRKASPQSAQFRKVQGSIIEALTTEKNE